MFGLFFIFWSICQQFFSTSENIRFQKKIFILIAEYHILIHYMHLCCHSLKSTIRILQCQAVSVTSIIPQKRHLPKQTCSVCDEPTDVVYT